MANQNSIADLSTTPASNTNFKGQSIVGSVQLVKNIDEAERNIGAMLAAMYDSLGGSQTAGGTATALTVTITEEWAALAHGLRLDLKAPSAATGASTLVVTVPTVGALPSSKIRRQGDSAIQANDWLANGHISLEYDSAYDSAAGAWVLLNPAGGGALDTLWAKGSNVASASTISLGAGNFFHITGTTTITDIDFTSALDGRMAWLEFDGILTITHNGTTLNLPGGANITTAAGDRAVIVQDSGDNVHMVFYQRAGGSPSAGINLGAPVSASGTALDVTSIPPWVKRVTVTMSGLSTSGTSVPQFRVGSSAGVVATGYLGSTGVTAAASAATIQYTTGLGFTGTTWTATRTLQGRITCTLVDLANNIWLLEIFASTSDATQHVMFGTSMITLPGALDRLRLTMTNGTDTFDAGTVSVSWE